MTPAQILALAYDYAHTNAEEVDPGDATLIKSYRFLNVAIDKTLSRLMTDIDEGYDYEIWHTHAEADRANGEYLLPIEGVDEGDDYVAGCLKIERVSLKYIYNADRIYQDHVPAREVDPSLLSRDWTYYLESQSQGDPIYYVSDTSVFIAPEFKTDDLGADPNNQIKLTGIRTNKLLDVTDADSTTIVPIPRQVQHIIAKGWAAEFMQSRLRQGEKNDANNDFINELDKMVLDLGSRTLAPDEATVPDDTHLQY